MARTSQPQKDTPQRVKPHTPSLIEKADFGFKGDALGETVEEFQTRNSNARCFGEVLVKCQLNEQSLLGIKLDTAEYSFFGGKLCQINLAVFTSINGHKRSEHNDTYEAVRSAYQRKYGDSALSNEAVYQNGFGALSSVHSLLWTDSIRHYGLTLTDSPGEYVNVIFSDLTAVVKAKKATSKIKPDDM